MVYTKDSEPKECLFNKRKTSNSTTTVCPNCGDPHKENYMGKKVPAKAVTTKPAAATARPTAKPIRIESEKISFASLTKRQVPSSSKCNDERRTHQRIPGIWYTGPH